MFVSETVEKDEKSGQWRLAKCKIHNSKDYPEECERFVMGFGHCSLGTAIWKDKKEKDPKVKLPEQIKNKVK